MDERDIADAFDTKPWPESHELHPIRQSPTDSSLANLTNPTQYRHGHGYRSPLSVFRTDYWFIEILGFVVAVACFVSIVVILAVHQNKRAPDWPGGVTLNSGHFMDLEPPRGLPHDPRGCVYQSALLGVVQWEGASASRCLLL